jgi:hypothetical protein
MNTDVFTRASGMLNSGHEIICLSLHDSLRLKRSYRASFFSSQNFTKKNREKTGFSP